MKWQKPIILCIGLLFLTAFLNFSNFIPPAKGLTSLPRLEISGNKIQYANGTQMWLKGVNIWHYAWDDMDAEDQAGYMGNWGVNCAMPLIQNDWVTNQPHREQMDAIIEENAQNGIYTVIMYQYYAWYDFSKWEEWRWDNWVTLWENVATRYNGSTNILYSIMDEPVGLTYSQYQYRMQEAVDAIRAIDSDVIIAINALSPDSNSAMGLWFVENYPISDSQIIYEGHSFSFNRTPDRGWETSYSKNDIRSWIISRDWKRVKDSNLPVWCGSINYDALASNGATWLANFFEVLNEDGYIGFNAWAWWTKGEMALLVDWSGNPSASGAVLQGYLEQSQPTPVLPFEDNYERGDLSKWNGTDVVNGEVDVTVSPVYQETYSANFTVDGASGDGVKLIHYLQPIGEFYQRTWVRLEDLPVNGNDFSLMGSSNSSDDYINYVGVMQNGSGTYWKLRVAQTPTDNDKVYFKDDIHADQWYQIELYIQIGVSGNSTLWVNGTQILSVTGNYAVHTNVANAYPELWCGDNQGAVATIYHDNYRADTQYIGGGVPIVFLSLEVGVYDNNQDTISGVAINGSQTNEFGVYQWYNLSYNTIYTFIVEKPIGYYPAWVTDVDGSFSWNTTHYIITHNLTETETDYLQIAFSLSSQTYIQSSNGTLSSVSIGETDFETTHEDYFIIIVEGNTGDTVSLDVYVPTQGEPNAVYGASSYNWSSLVLSVNVTLSSSATIQIVWTDTTTWGGFNLFFQNGHSLSFQSEYTLTVEVTSGLLNATSGTLDMSQEQGTLRFTATNDSTLTVTSPDAEGGFQISISGATETDHVGGFTYDTTISTGDTVTIWWGWRLESWADMYTLLGIGLGGVALMVASPTWVALELRKKIDANSLERLGYGVLLFIIGWGCVIIWLWS